MEKQKSLLTPHSAHPHEEHDPPQAQVSHVHGAMVETGWLPFLSFFLSERRGWIELSIYNQFDGN